MRCATGTTVAAYPAVWHPLIEMRAEPFDVHAHRPPQIAFNHEVVELISDASQILFGQLIGALCGVNACGLKNLLG